MPGTYLLWGYRAFPFSGIEAMPIYWLWNSHMEAHLIKLEAEAIDEEAKILSERLAGWDKVNSKGESSG